MIGTDSSNAMIGTDSSEQIVASDQGLQCLPITKQFINSSTDGNMD